MFKTIVFLCGFFLVLFPFSITVLHDVHGVIIALATIFALVLYFTADKSISFDATEKRFFASILFIIISIFAVSIIAGIDEMVMKKLFKYLYLLLVIPIYFLFRTTKFSYGLLWYGLFIGAVVSALYGVNQTMKNPVFDTAFVWRAKGVTNAIIYGDIALLLGVMCLAGIGWFRAKANWQMILPVIAAVMGVLASALSQSRGGWVALPVLLLVFIWYSRFYVTKSTQFLSVAAIMGVIIVIYLVPQTRVELKLDETITNIQMYINSDVNSKYRETSIGVRLEAWKAAWFVFLDNPLIGVGWGNLQENAKVYVDNGEINKSAIIYSHPHNQFLSVMASGGIIATIAIFFLFYIPFKVFYTACKSKESSSDQRRIALAGILFIVGFVIFNLSESFLERSRTVSFFIFYLAVFMAGIRERDSGVISHILHFCNK
ncbi:MAG: O-antigen ligase family protein [Bacteroidota bacterium]